MRRLQATLLVACICALNVYAVEPIEPEMVEVPAGKFRSGSNAAEREIYIPSMHEFEQHEVDLPAYQIGKFEISNQQYERFMQDGGYDNADWWSEDGWAARNQFAWTEPRRWRDPGHNGIHMEQYAVAAVSYFEAEAYCRWLAQRTGKPYRLPTEMEWEKAARGTDGRVFPWGGDWRDGACNWVGSETGQRLPTVAADGFAYTAPGGSFPEGVSPYGCEDMAGNVMEWVDAFMQDDAMTIQRPMRVFKGGSFFSGFKRLLRCSWRGASWPEVGHVYWGEMGFRIAMDGDDSPSE